MIKFSVLISVYWKEKPEFLRESLNSVFTQTRSADEVVVVKDGPLTPELDAIICNFKKEHAELRIVSLEKNMGLGIALNKGINACSYDYVARMDSDDICFPQRFEKQIGYLEKHPDIDALGCWTQEFTENERNEKILMAKKMFPVTAWDIFKYCTKRNPMEHPSIVLKKQTVIEAGNYQSYYLFEDYSLWAHMLVKGANFHNLPEVLLYFRMTPDSFKRRGGWKYAISEIKTLNAFRRIGFLSNLQYFISLLRRIPIRLMPSVMRKFVYQTFLRRTNKEAKD